MPEPTTTIDALPEASTPLAPTDLIIVQQSGVTKKASADAAGLGGSGGGGGSAPGNVMLYWEGTQAQWDALGVYSNNTQYNIVADVAPPLVVPGTPTSISAVAGDTTATINWQPPSSGTTVTGYDVQRSTQATTGFSTVASVASNIRSYHALGLINGATYYFRVVATNSVGAGTPSTAVSVLPLGVSPVVPGVPSNIAVVAGAGTLTTNWLAPASDGGSPITSYTVQRSTTSATTGFTNVASVSPSTLSYLATGLTNGTTYWVRVYATNAIGIGTPTTAVSGVPTAGATAPSAPLNVVATPGVNAVTITWDPPTSNGGLLLNGYSIERSLSSSTGFVQIVSMPATSAELTYTSVPLTAGTTYYFRVIAFQDAGNSPASTVVNAVPTAGAGTPATWQDAYDSNDVAQLTAWYTANVGYDTEGHTSGDLWGPGQSAIVTINDAWLTANAGAKVVLSGGRWTVTDLHAQRIIVQRDNVTLFHCFADRPSTVVHGDLIECDGFSGLIADHCTMDGHFGSGADSDDGNGFQVFNATVHAADTFIARYCEVTAVRAGFQFFFGSTAEYCWTHDLYQSTLSHNTSGSFRGENCRFYRNLFSDGSSSAISLYAETTPYNNFDIIECVLAVAGHANQEINFPPKLPNNWHLLSNGYHRELIRNKFDLGIVSENTYFTKTHGNRLLSGHPILGDEGGTPVANQPILHKYAYNEVGHSAAVGAQSTFEFIPSPNSTLFIFANITNGSHANTQAPQISVVGQYPQTFTPILATAFDNQPYGDALGQKSWLYQAETGANTSFQHITVAPYATALTAYWGFWVIEVTGRTGMTLAHSSVTTGHGIGYGGNIDTITSAALSGAATTGRLCIAFAGGDTEETVGTFGDVSGWTKFAVMDNIFPSTLNTVGAFYWRNNFTGTTITIPDLGGAGVHTAGLILTEWN